MWECSGLARIRIFFLLEKKNAYDARVQGQFNGLWDIISDWERIKWYQFGIRDLLTILSSSTGYDLGGAGWLKNGFCGCPDDVAGRYAWLPDGDGVVDENLGTVVPVVAVDADADAVTVAVATVTAVATGGGDTNCGGGYGLEPGGAWDAWGTKNCCCTCLLAAPPACDGTAVVCAGIAKFGYCTGPGLLWNWG